jgi:hypothetical protein
MSKPSTPERNSRLAEEIRVMNKLVAVIVRIGKPNALRILEAAERIDRKGALQFLDSYTRPEDYKPHQYPSIRALIESLPDPEKEPEK